MAHPVNFYYLILIGIFLRPCSSLGMMYAPQSVEPQYASTAGMFGAAMLITGIFSGLMFSSMFPMLVQSVGW